VQLQCNSVPIIYAQYLYWYWYLKVRYWYLYWYLDHWYTGTGTCLLST